MRARIVDRLAELNSLELARLTEQHPDFGPGLLAAIEGSSWGGARVAYAAVEDERGLVAFCPLVFGTNLNFLAALPVTFRELYDRLLRTLGTGLAPRVLVAGTLFSDKGWVPHRADATAAAFESLIQAIETFCSREAIDLCFFKDLHRDFAHRELWRARGYREMHSLPTVKLNTAFPDMNAYIASLSSNGRSHARRNIARARKVFEIEVVRDFAAQIDAVFGLFRATYLRAEFQLDELTPRFFELCAGMQAPNSELVLVRDHGEVVGAYLMFFTAAEQVNKRVGFRRDHPQSALIYNAMHYLCVERAIARGIPQSYFGQTTYVPKLRLGGELEDQFLYVKAFRAYMRPSLLLQARYMRRFESHSVLASLSTGRND